MSNLSQFYNQRLIYLESSSEDAYVIKKELTKIRYENLEIGNYYYPDVNKVLGVGLKKYKYLGSYIPSGAKNQTYRFEKYDDKSLLEVKYNQVMIKKEFFERGYIKATRLSKNGFLLYPSGEIGT